MNDSCTWPPDPRHVHRGADRRHLVADVRVAEELAMRHADAHFDSRASHGRLQSACEATLFTLISRSHGIATVAMEQARRELDADVWDAPVHLPLIVFYAAAAVFLARQIRRRFPSDEKAAAAVATLLGSLLIAVVFQVLGHLWDGVVEMIRVGNTHMSYRVERLGWRGYTEKVLVAAVVLFWGLVLASYHPAGGRALSRKAVTPSGRLSRPRTRNWSSPGGFP